MPNLLAEMRLREAAPVALLLGGVEPLMSNAVRSPKIDYSRTKPLKAQRAKPTTVKNVRNMPERWFAANYPNA